MVTRASSGRFRAAAMNFWVFSARKAISLPARSSRMKVTPPAVPTPWMAGGEKAKAFALGELAQLAVEAGDDGRGLLLRPLPLVPVLQRDEEEAAVGVADIAQQVEADDRGAVLHARGVAG